MIEFADILYGTIKLPDWIMPFIKLPEFLRLRGVRLSNVDSFQFKDFSGPNRWEHSIAVAYLAQICAEKRKLPEKEKIQLILAALLHDVATPPFAHTAEYVLDNFDHEFESYSLIKGTPGKDFRPDWPIYASQISQFAKAIKKLQKSLRLDIDIDTIANMVIGNGDIGFLVHGTIDLDNIDNVVRACLHIGIDVDRQLPLQLAAWLAEQQYPPTDIDTICNSGVRKWAIYRKELYKKFFLSSDEEIARQAFLQHLMRKAIRSGFPRKSLIWNTDDSLLLTFALEQDGKDSVRYPLSRLTERYMLIECPTKIVHMDIENEEELRILRQPDAVEWIEEQMSTANFEAMVYVSSRRYKENLFTESLLPPAPGSLYIFKLGKEIKYTSLPEWLKNTFHFKADGHQMCNLISSSIQEKTKVWAKNKPWLEMTPKRKDDIIANLKHVGNWSFSLSRNDNLHPYPSTFVYTIPANLIDSLHLKGELVIDPFGGIGQTAVEAVKYGGKAISADSNSLACLFARAKLTFLSRKKREELRKISIEQLSDLEPCSPPDVENIRKWFNAKTLNELCRIWRYIENYNNNNKAKDFLKVCFSAILYSCTARKGKHHTYFADNTPLPAELKAPPYECAYDLFLTKVKDNVDVIERLYASIERSGRDPQEELANAKVLQIDATRSTPSEYGIEPNSIAAIITSPPYLCMADYSFGLRLSYYWLDPNGLEKDYCQELGARHQRKKPERAVEEYFDGIQKFAQNAAILIRRNGFLATVYGAPIANSFKSIDVFKQFDSILQKQGFRLIWQHMRSLHNRRGYGCIESERVAVHVYDK